MSYFNWSKKSASSSDDDDGFREQQRRGNTLVSGNLDGSNVASWFGSAKKLHLTSTCFQNRSDGVCPSWARDGVRTPDRSPPSLAFMYTADLESPVNLSPLTACLWTVGTWGEAHRERPRPHCGPCVKQRC